MKSLVQFLRTPHPFILNVGSILIPGFIAFLLILVFAPFGFSALELANRVILAFMFGLISSFGVLMVVGVLKWLAPGFMQEESWTAGKELILILSVIFGICLLNFAIILMLGLFEDPLLELFERVVLYTLAISILPVIVLILFEQFMHQRKKLAQAKKLTEQLRRQSTHEQSLPENTPSANTIVFEAENGKMELQLKPEEILFLNADGNYVEIHYLEDTDSTKKKLIRNRLKNFTSILPEKLFFHCHKSYIVNSLHITSVEGNARNLELIMRGTNQRVPVSRSKSDALSGFLK